MFKLVMIFFLIVALTAKAKPTYILAPDKKWLSSELVKLKMSRMFISDLLENYEESTFTKVLKLNTTGFINPPSHRKLVTEEAVASSKNFIERYKIVLNEVEKKYLVPTQVISALLWVETRHGSLTGQYHTPSVYLHLLHGDRNNVSKDLAELAIQELGPSNKKHTLTKVRKKISQNLLRKKKWAMSQLRSLEIVHWSKGNDLSNLRGSYAGAIGIPQFLPSSYLSYARAYASDKKPNLFEPSDAITSVASYLKANGWKTHDRKRQLKSLLSYNKSRDYADAILEIATKIGGFESNIPPK